VRHKGKKGRRRESATRQLISKVPLVKKRKGKKKTSEKRVRSMEEGREILITMRRRIGGLAMYPKGHKSVLSQRGGKKRRR